MSLIIVGVISLAAGVATVVAFVAQRREDERRAHRELLRRIISEPLIKLSFTLSDQLSPALRKAMDAMADFVLQRAKDNLETELRRLEEESNGANDSGAD